MLFKNATIYTMEQEPFVGDFRVDMCIHRDWKKFRTPKQ